MKKLESFVQFSPHDGEAARRRSLWNQTTESRRRGATARGLEGRSGFRVRMFCKLKWSIWRRYSPGRGNRRFEMGFWLCFVGCEDLLRWEEIGEEESGEWRVGLKLKRQGWEDFCIFSCGTGTHCWGME